MDVAMASRKRGKQIAGMRESNLAASWILRRRYAFPAAAAATHPRVLDKRIISLYGGRFFFISPETGLQHMYRRTIHQILDMLYLINDH